MPSDARFKGVKKEVIGMADDQGVNVPEGQTQEVATPATDQQVPAEPKVEEKSSQDEGTDELGLPKDASERTRQRVQDLLEENKALKEAQFQAPEPVYQAPIAPLPVGNVPPKTDEFGNANPAYLDFLEKRVEAREQADYHRQQTEIQRSVKAEAQEAENAHPEIKTNKALLNMARGVKTDSLVYPESYGGRELSLKEALDFVKTQGKTEKPSTPEPSQEKIDASTSVEGRPSQAVQRELSDDRDDLVWGTRLGDKDASIARFKRVPAGPQD